MGDGDDPEQWLPVLDLGPLLAGEEGALEAFAKGLRAASEGIGFYFLEGYEAILPESLALGVLKAASVAHALPQEAKEAWWMDKSDSGFLPVGATTKWGSNGRPPLPESENASDAVIIWGNGPPWVPPSRQLTCFAENNLLPDAVLPGFRETTSAYLEAIEQLARAMLPAFALALEQDASFFDGKFDKPCWCLRLNHYPPTDGGEVGVTPHADGDFCTFLLQGDQQGLSVLRSTDGEWAPVPARGSHSMVVNTGNSLMRLSNGRFPSTMHTASCTSSGPGARARFSVPFFWSPSVDVVIEPLPAFITEECPSQYDGRASGNVESSGRVGFAARKDSSRSDARADTFYQSRLHLRRRREEEAEEEATTHDVAA